jgi:hypothetical protein
LAGEPLWCAVTFSPLEKLVVGSVSNLVIGRPSSLNKNARTTSRSELFPFLGSLLSFFAASGLILCFNLGPGGF